MGIGATERAASARAVFKVGIGFHGKLRDCCGVLDASKATLVVAANILARMTRTVHPYAYRSLLRMQEPLTPSLLQVDHLAAEPGVWEQEMFQTQILPYIVDTFEHRDKLFGSEEAAAFYRSQNCQKLFLRFQHLPLKAYHNIRTMKARHRLHLSVDSVIIHCG